MTEIKEKDGVNLFDKVPTDKPLISDHDFWRGVSEMLTAAEVTYGKQMQTIASMIDGRCKSFYALEKDSKQTAFMDFMTDVNRFRNEILTKSKRASVDGEQFQKDVYAFKNFQLDPIVKLDADLHERHYHDVKTAFLKEKALLEARQQKYHVLALEHEKTELEMIAVTCNELKFMELDTRLLQLERKIRKAELKYRTAVMRAQDQHEQLVKASVQFEDSWKKRELERADRTCRILYQSVRRRQKYNNMHRDALFKDIDADGIIDNLGETWRVQNIVFQEPKRERIQRIKTELYKAYYGRELDVEGMNPVSIDECLVEKVYAYRDFKKLYPWQLSLKQGCALKQLLPPNRDGFAFGEYVTEKGNRCRGFFPANCVASRDSFAHAPSDHVTVHCHGNKKAEANKHELLIEMQARIEAEDKRVKEMLEQVTNKDKTSASPKSSATKSGKVKNKANSAQSSPANKKSPVEPHRNAKSADTNHERFTMGFFNKVKMSDKDNGKINKRPDTGKENNKRPRQETCKKGTKCPEDDSKRPDKGHNKHVKKHIDEKNDFFRRLHMGSPYAVKRPRKGEEHLVEKSDWVEEKKEAEEALLKGLKC